MGRRAQSGLDRLALFVLVVLAVLIVVPTGLGFLGVDIRHADTSGADGTGAAGPAPDLIVLTADATAIDDARASVGAVTLVVTRSPATEPVDLSEVTVTWADGGAYTLVHAGSAGPAADGEFEASLARDGRDGTTLSQSGDRGVLRFDLGTDDVGGVAEFGERLPAGETVTVELTTASGRTTTANLTVPDPIPSGRSVAL